VQFIGSKAKAKVGTIFYEHFLDALFNAFDFFIIFKRLGLIGQDFCSPMEKKSGMCV